MMSGSCTMLDNWLAPFFVLERGSVLLEFRMASKRSH